MANLEAQPKWSSVRLLETHELARGGLNGNMNEQAKALAERTEFLNQEKASKSEIVQGVFEFGTYAEFNAAKATLPHNCTVILDEENTNGAGQWAKGWNRWDGTNLIKSSNDIASTSKKYTNEKVKAAIETVYDNLAVNLINILDISKLETGFYYNALTGEKEAAVATPTYCCAIYSMKANTAYQVTSGYLQLAFYDVDMNFISGLASVPTLKFTTPAATAYAGVTIRESSKATYMLCEEAHFPAQYIPFYMTLDNVRLRTNQVLGLEDRLQSFLSAESLNIINTDTVTIDRYVNYTTGGLDTNTSFVATDFLPIKPSTEYQTTTNYKQQFGFYDQNKVYISGQATATPSYKFTTPANAKYVRFSVGKAVLNSLMVAESSLFPSEYVPYSTKVLTDVVLHEQSVKIVDIIASADESDSTAQFKGKNAIQLALDSITDASEKKRYRILTKGKFEITQAIDYIGYRGYPSMILAKDFVAIIGDGSTVISASLPYDDAAIGASIDGNTYARTQYQTLYTYAKEALIEGITFVAKNTRYALHLDNPNGANKRHDFKNVSFVFKGDKGSKQALGVGTSSGEKTYFDGGKCHSDAGVPFYCHNNTKFTSASLMSFNNYSFSSNVEARAIKLDNDGSCVKDKLELNNCSFSGSTYVVSYVDVWLKKNPAQNYDHFDHAEWEITGGNNSPFCFDNLVGGLSLRFKTTVTGDNQTIRFNPASSAYGVLIKNSQAANVVPYTDSYDYLNGYIVCDGSSGSSALAIGCKDVSEVAGLYDSSVIYTSLGKRLGDCSSNSKSLGVIVNGTETTITFNKNYSSMTNAQILSEINSSLSGLTVDLYSYGRDYYPMLADTTEYVYNSTASAIAKGSVLTKSKNGVRLASVNDVVFGVALDDIAVMRTLSDGSRKGQGRVLKRGYIYTSQSKAHFVLADNQAAAIGTRFNVSNGQLVADANGKISVDIDTGVVSINC